MKKKLILLILCSVLVLIVSIDSSVKASPLPPFSLPLDNVFSVPTGSNSYVEGDVTVITKDINYQIGSIFSTDINKLDLTQSFHAEMYVYLGNKLGNVADGMTFVMHTDKKRIDNFTGIAGEHLGVYAKIGSDTNKGLQEQMERSFAIEFDTYYNFDRFHNSATMDRDLSANSNKGHIAYSFPDLKSSYNLTASGTILSLIHRGLYYPSDYLSNGKWHLFSIDWNADTKKLDYKFDDAPTVSVPINPMTVFGSTSVYWGFTGSTGGSSQESKVAFKQIPGLVNLSSDMKITKDEKDITKTGVSGTEGDIKVQFDLKYDGGKQKGLLNPTFNLKLDDLLTFKPGTLTVNGTVVRDEYFVNGQLTYNFPKNLNAEEDMFTISFEGTPKVITDKERVSSINYSVVAKNYIGNDLKTTFPIKKDTIVKSIDFENQSWLINEINRQFSPRKINQDIYLSDLAKITIINSATGVTYPTEYIPAAINKLPNLTHLQIENLNLIGSLPIELGDLDKLTTLSISGNKFDSEIPVSLGKLSQIEFLSLNNNQLKGLVPTTISSLPNLKKINLNDNPLSGQIPDFSMSMEQINLNNTQLTYNLATVPLFLKNVEGRNYSNTFIEGLKLTGNSKVSSKNTQLQPFNESDSGYFNLQALQENGVSQELHNEHTYTIKNTANGTIYYQGLKNIEATIPYDKNISYTIILDEAEQNPNNVFVVLGKERELKFEEVPATLVLKIKLGMEKQPISLNGNLSVFDDRENKDWKLSITLSELTQGQKKLQGEYSYTSKDGISHSIANEQKFLLETGVSDTLNEVIPISWDNKHGLSYTAYSSNLIGNYTGDVTWTLEDTP